MGANTLLNTSSVEEECGGAIFSEVLSFWFSISFIGAKYLQFTGAIFSEIISFWFIISFTSAKYFHFTGAIFGIVYAHSCAEYLLCTDVAFAVPPLKIDQWTAVVQCWLCDIAWLML